MKLDAAGRVSTAAGVFLVLLAACGGDPAHEPPPPTGVGYVDDLRHLTGLLREKWSWRELREEEGVDLATLEAEAIALSKAEPGDRGFLRGLTRYVAGIRDGHAAVALEGVDLQEARQWPFSLIEVAEGLMVDGIAPETFAAGTLKRGDIVLAVDGRPIDEIIAEQERFVFASTPAARRRKAIFDLTESTANTSYDVRVLRRGREDAETVTLVCPPPESPVPRRSWRAFKEAYEDLDADTAFYCVGNFAPKDAAFADATTEERHRILESQYDAYARVAQKLAGKRNLILDLRRNPGGTDLLGQALALHLLEPGFPYYALSSRRDGQWSKPHTYRPEVGRGAPRFQGRVLCLIDEETFSVADNLAACLRDEHPDVLFLGRPTGGGSGAPRTFTLPATKARVTFCTMRVYAPNGRAIEGAGVAPDVDVRPTRDQVLAGEDAVRKAALEALAR